LFESVIVYLSCICFFGAFWPFSTIDVAFFANDNLATMR